MKCLRRPRTCLLAVLAGIASLAKPVQAMAQPQAGPGKREYDSSCAVCHIVTGP